MGFLDFLWRKTTPTPQPLRLIKARYEAASPEHFHLWRNADGYSADAAGNAGARKALRERARSQVENDPLAEHLADVLATDVVGRGPQLQVIGDSIEANAEIERLFWNWARAIRLHEKLRTMRRAKAVDGEAFAVLSNNENLPGPIKLDLRLIEADQVTSPFTANWDRSAVDGIEFDSYGNVSTYIVLRDHPGSAYAIGTGLAYDRIPAASMLHLFDAKRPQQHRGISEFAPSLILFEYRRRHCLATVQAAEIAADYAAILKSDAPADGAAAVTPLETIPIDRGTFTAMPQGWDLSQLKAEQPTTTYPEFQRTIIGDIARTLCIPIGRALNDHSSYNYSSAKLEWQQYRATLQIQQDQFEGVVLDRILAAWSVEAGLLGLIPKSDDPLSHLWIWPGSESIDPLKEANAQTVKLANGTTTLRDEAAREGKDWEDILKQRAIEMAMAKELGIGPSNTSTEQSTEEEDEEDESADKP